MCHFGPNLAKLRGYFKDDVGMLRVGRSKEQERVGGVVSRAGGGLACVDAGCSVMGPILQGIGRMQCGWVLAWVAGVAGLNEARDCLYRTAARLSPTRGMPLSHCSSTQSDARYHRQDVDLNPGIGCKPEFSNRMLTCVMGGALALSVVHRAMTVDAATCRQCCKTGLHRQRVGKGY